MEKHFEVSILLDTYGKLLTKRQFEIIDLYYNNDYSLGEIAEELGISRQGVHDNIKRSEKYLYKIETKLGFMKRNELQKKYIEILADELKSLENKIDKVIMQNLKKQIRELNKL